jgi:hypothetical protein
MLVACLAASQSVCAQPLSPGKPAGVHQARHGASTGLLIAGGALVAGLIAVLAFRGNGNDNGLVVPNNTGTNP